MTTIKKGTRYRCVNREKIKNAYSYEYPIIGDTYSVVRDQDLHPRRDMITLINTKTHHINCWYLKHFALEDGADLTGYEKELNDILTMGYRENTE